MYNEEKDEKQQELQDDLPKKKPGKPVFLYTFIALLTIAFAITATMAGFVLSKLTALQSQVGDLEQLISEVSQSSSLLHQQVEELQQLNTDLSKESENEALNYGQPIGPAAVSPAPAADENIEDPKASAPEDLLLPGDSSDQEVISDIQNSQTPDSGSMTPSSVPAENTSKTSGQSKAEGISGLSKPQDGPDRTEDASSSDSTDKEVSSPEIGSADGSIDGAASKDAASQADDSSKGSADQTDGSSKESADQADGSSKESKTKADGSSKESADQADSSSKESADQADDSSKETADQADDSSKETSDQADGSSKEAADQADDSSKETSDQADDSSEGSDPLKGEGTISPPSGTSDTADLSMDNLMKQVEVLLPKNNGSWSVYVCNLKKGTEGVIEEHPMQAASLIKLFIMGAVYENYDALVQSYGQQQVDGKLLPMITVSDNDAANTLVNWLGKGDDQAGMDVVNSFCKDHSYTNTSMGRLLLASNANSDNYTSVTDCGKFLREVYEINNGTSADPSLSHADSMYYLLKLQERRNKIPAQLPEGVQTANKTGELDNVENDAGIIYDTAKGVDLVVCFMSENLTDVISAQNSIADNSRCIYGYFNE